jgi:hypothetical protein
MNKRSFASLGLLPLLTIGACAASIGSETRTIRPESAQVCAEQCTEIGLKLTAVAIMADHIGCVCQAEKAPVPVTVDAVPAAGMATIEMIRQRRQAQQTQQQPAH